jgi:hypothetical protein
MYNTIARLMQRIDDFRMDERSSSGSGGESGCESESDSESDGGADAVAQTPADALDLTVEEAQHMHAFAKAEFALINFMQLNQAVSQKYTLDSGPYVESVPLIGVGYHNRYLCTKSDFERDCIYGVLCEGMLIARRRGCAGLVLKEFLMPEQESQMNATVQRGEPVWHPKTHGPCLLCDRFETNVRMLWRDELDTEYRFVEDDASGGDAGAWREFIELQQTRSGGLRGAKYALMLANGHPTLVNTHRVKVNCADGYRQIVTITAQRLGVAPLVGLCGDALVYAQRDYAYGKDKRTKKRIIIQDNLIFGRASTENDLVTRTAAAAVVATPEDPLCHLFC